MHLLLLLLLLLPSIAAATGESNPIVFSGVETMKFQNGNYPTEAYSGITFFSMAEDSTGVTKGDGKGVSEHAWSADSTLKVGLTTAANAQRALFKVDLSALPDSAQIVSAKVKMMKTTANATGYNAVTVTAEMGFWRLYWDWDARVNWTNRRNNEAGAANDTVWTTAGSTSAGAGDTVFRWEGFGMVSVNLQHHVPWAQSHVSAPTDFDFPRSLGPDSLYSGIHQISSNYGARTTEPDVSGPFRPFVAGTGGDATDACWLEFDITNLVRAWHTNRWKNQGCLMSVIGEPTTKDVTFHSSYYEGGGSVFTPLVTVEYLYAVASSGGSGRRGGGFAGFRL